MRDRCRRLYGDASRRVNGTTGFFLATPPDPDHHPSSSRRKLALSKPPPEQPEAWKPALTPGIDLRGLPLTPEEGFVASRLDGLTDLHGISVGTGLSAERVAAALDRLRAPGAGAAPPGLAGEGARA